MQNFSLPSMVMVNSLESVCQSSCQVVVSVVVKGLLSEGFNQSDCGQRAAVRASDILAAVGVNAVRELLLEGFCQSRWCQRAADRGLLYEWLLS